MRSSSRTRKSAADDFLVVDISNTFTKFAVSSPEKLGRVQRIPTRELSAKAFHAAIDGLSFGRVVVASVVPARNASVTRAAGQPVLEVGPRLALGVGIDYPKPASIGADRLANAAACAALYDSPAIVVDFGTAVTFDVISTGRKYIGGVIAPGLDAMTEYLHSRTALLPRITLEKPTSAVGRTTRQAMLSGAVHGYHGLVKEIIARITAEAFSGQKPTIVATGGDATLIAGATSLFDAIDPHLTLQGLRIIANLNRP